MSKYEKALESIYEEAEARIQKLADQYRVEVLIPACKRAKMTYMAGNGTFAFFPIVSNPRALYNSIRTVGDAELKNKKYLIPVIECLNTSTLGSNVQCFGFYISDVTEEDIK